MIGLLEAFFSDPFEAVAAIRAIERYQKAG